MEHSRVLIMNVEVAMRQSCVTMQVNQRGEIKTASGFSKSLLLMGLAIGAGIDAIRDKRSAKQTASELYRLQELLRMCSIAGVLKMCWIAGIE